MNKRYINSPSGNSRRDFLNILSLIGLSAFTLPAHSANSLSGDKIFFGNDATTGTNNEDVLTIDTINETEKIIGINFTKKQKEQILHDLNSNLNYIQQLRDVQINNSNFPIISSVNKAPTIEKEEGTEVSSLEDSKLVIPKTESEIAFLEIRQLAYLIRTRQLSSLDLTNIYLRRLKRFNSKLNFVITITEELAIKQAKEADQEICRGKYRGLLHGIPYGLKDLFAVEGYKTTWGTEYYKDQVFNYNSTVYNKLTEAGGVLVAKLAMGAFASGEEWYGGITKNPWNTNRTSGGSSSGPASAVASGCIPFALGTETNGSMVSPCHECGTTGFRPSFGQVSRFGAMVMSWSFDKVTPISKSVEDCAIVYSNIIGSDGKDNSVIDPTFSWDYGKSINDINIGYHSRFFEEELMGNPEDGNYKNHLIKIREISRGVLDFFQDRGKKLTALDFDIDSKGCGIMLEVEAAAAFDEYTKSHLHDSQEINSWPKKFRQYRFLPAVDYIKAARYRMEVIKQLEQALKGIDVYIEITWSNNWTTNLAGLPIIVMPCGFLYDRPVSITFVGSFNKEEELFVVANEFQKATRYNKEYPKLIIN